MRQVALMVEVEPRADNEPLPAVRASLQQTANIEPSAAKFEALYQAHHDDVFYFCLRRLGGSGNIGPAEDVTHEAFTTVWRRLDAMPRQPEEAKAWIYGVARNCILHYQRSTSRLTALNIKVAANSSIGQSAAIGHQATIAPDEVAIQNLDFARSWQQLSAADQEALSLAAFEDLTAAQAAQVLGITASAYKFRLHSARNKLRKALNQ